MAVSYMKSVTYTTFCLIGTSNLSNLLLWCKIQLRMSTKYYQLMPSLKDLMRCFETESMYKLDLGYVRFLQAEDKSKLSKLVLIIGDLYNLLP